MMNGTLNFLTNKYDEESSDDENNTSLHEKLHDADDDDEQVWHFGEPTELNTKSK